MVAFASFPARATTLPVIGHDYQDEDEDDGMDLDVGDENAPHLTCPGAPLTSAQAFMRYATIFISRSLCFAIFLYGDFYFLVIPLSSYGYWPLLMGLCLMQRTWYICGRG
jgi:hypothetical protein